MLPTAELHVHIEGTLEPELLVRLARRNGVALPATDPDELRAAYQFTSLQSFLDLYYRNVAVLRSEADFRELAMAYLARAASAGVRRAEIFFDPQQHLGLDSTEVGYPPALFRDVFGAAAAEGLHRVAHAGEEAGPEYVWQALDVLGAERIDHGIRSMEDASLIRRLRDDRIPLTVCPLSNVALRAVGSLTDHVLRRGPRRDEPQRAPDRHAGARKAELEAMAAREPDPVGPAADPETRHRA